MTGLLVLGAVAGTIALVGWSVLALCEVIDLLKEWLG